MSNNKYVKIVLSLLVAILIMCGMPLNVLAESEEGDGVVASGYLDSDSSVEWKLIVNDDKGTESYYGDLPTYTLEISGSGAIPDFEEPESTSYTYYKEVWPWYQYVFEYDGRNQSRRTGYITRLIIKDGITWVGKNAFWGGATGDIKELSIADSIEYIGESAFSGMNSLKTNIILPSSLKKVDKYAFYNSYNNAGIIFRGTDTVVCDHAFDNCAANSLGQVADLTGVTSLGEGAFNGCYSLVEVKNTDDIKTVGKDAFRDCQQLEKISLPGISSIPDGLFYNCYKLKSFEINGNITEIGTIGEENDDVWYDGAFYNCWELSNIEIPKSVISIGNHTFDFCEALSSVIFESGRSKAIDIGTGAFANCYSLTSIKLPEGMTKLSAGILAACPIESIELPSSVRVIEDGCFSGNESLKSITLHEGLESIGERAFSYCTNLETVNFPSSLRSIGEEAFRECKSLKNLVIPSGMTEVPGYIYNNCESAETIVIPDSVTIIGDRAFTGCKNVKELKLPKNLKSIGKQAFQNVSKITELTIPSSVETIDEHAFASLPLITSVVIPDKVEELSGTFSGCTSLAEVKLPTGLKKIGKDTFMMCYPLKKINLSETQVTEIGDRAFAVDPYNAFKGNQLTDIKLPETLKTIGAQAFDGCIRLESIVLPESVETIGDHAFAGIDYNMKLKNITIGEKAIFLGEDIFMCCPDDLTITGKTRSLIESYAIEHNINFESTGNTDYNPVLESGSIDGTTISWEIDSKGVLTVKSSENGAAIPDFEVKYMYADTPWVKYSEIIKKIVVEDSIEVIGICAFRDLESVKSVELPENLKKIRLAAFAYCKSLEEITLPEGLTALGSGTFAACYKLKSINIPGSITSWCEGRDSFDTEDGHFTQCKSLKEVTIPPQLSKIYSDMFSDCTSLEKVNMHSGITEIDHTAFENTAIRSIDLPEGLTRIGYDAFLGCENLVSINIPDKVTEIGNDAFSNCEKLVSLVLPKGLNHLEQRVFVDCTNLENVVFLSLAKADDITCYPDEVFRNNSDDLSIWIYKDSGFAEKLSEYSSHFKYIEADGSCGSDAGYIISESKDMLIYGRGSIDTASMDLSEVKTVYISEFITSISDASFADCKDSITIYALEGSYASTWAKENGFDYRIKGTHSYATEYTVDVEPTCTEPGSKSIHCIYCDEKKDVTVIKALGHLWNEGEITKEPTYTEKGVKTFKCTRSGCKETRTEEIPMLILEHTHIWDVKYTVDKAPTCEETGIKSIHCILCSVMKDEAEIPALGHDWGEGIVTKEPTYTEKGIKTHTCKNDNTHIKTIEIPTLEVTGDVVGEDLDEKTEENISTGEIWITGVKDVTYSGSAVTFDIRAYIGNKLLKEGTDYTIKYANNKNACRDYSEQNASKIPTVKLIGKGAYKNKVITKTFRIDPIDVNVEASKASNDIVEVKNGSYKPIPTLTVNGKKLKHKTDYIVVYDSEHGTGFRDVGDYSIKLEGVGNYRGTIVSTFRIVNKKEYSLLSKATVTGYAKKFVYDGTAKEQNKSTIIVKAKVGKTTETLIEGIDYTIAYLNNTEVGTASMIIRAVPGSKKYLGEKIINYSITGTPLSKARITYEKNQSYTGATVKPAVSLALADGKTLVDGADYTIEYQKNINAGTASIILKGKGIYTGTIKKSFKIKPVVLADNESIKVTTVGNVVKNAKGKYEIEVVVKNNAKTLLNGVDYTVSFKNNSKPGLATASIKGKGNYTKTTTIKFEIVESD